MMPTEIRSSFLESWEGTTFIETVRDMVNEVSGEEEDGEKIKNPKAKTSLTAMKKKKTRSLT